MLRLFFYFLPLCLGPPRCEKQNIYSSVFKWFWLLLDRKSVKNLLSFLEKELNITDPDAEEEKAQNNNAYSGAEGMGSGTQNKATDKRNNIEENLDDIEAALAQLKKELGL
nr:dnaJ homolog subfamily B member 9 isoform X2 [Ipomoea trifida]